MATDIRTSSLKQPLDVADYLFKRLKQVGIESIHGVPGDYNLVALDYVPRNGLRWVGNVNELNASYAADGYARVKGIAALVTTFGVGELSALNGIAGSFAEYVPVVHIVGTPSTLSQKNGMLLHHTLGNGDFTVFAGMSRNISCAVSALNDASNAAELIDHAIRECYVQSRPVYVTLPTDIVQKKVEGARLDTPLDLSYPENDQEQEDYAVSAILSHLEKAQRPVILVDACAIRHRAIEETHDLAVSSGLPTFVAPMGKGAVDESLPNYGGVYAGSGSHDPVREAVESSDLILSIGAIKSDFNTAGFTYHTSQLASVDFHSALVKVKYSEYSGLRMNGVLTKVAAHLRKNPLSESARAKPPALPKVADVQDRSEDGDEPITHAWLWPHFTEWVQPHDVILTETGTSGYGIWEVVFKPHTAAISQILWGSIGFATGAAQGAVLAARELEQSDSKKRRTLLFTGDGSFQLSAQEVSTMLRLKLAPVLFIINNKGYTIERFIHGMDAAYNDIGDWSFEHLLKGLGGHDYDHRVVSTRAQLRQLLRHDAFATSDQLRLVEIVMPWDDAPKALRLTAEASAANNAKMD